MATASEETVAKDDPEDLIKPIFKNGRFYNPWKGFVERGLMDFIKVLPKMSRIPNPKVDKKECQEHLEVLTPDSKLLSNPPDDKIQVCWLGHASVLTQFDGLSVLADPVFSQRCSPSQWVGPKRYRPCPCKVADLPKIDAVIISHNHYDHLDVDTVKKLNAKYGEDLHWFVPMKVKKWMEGCGVKNVQEMTWWDEATIPGKDQYKFVFTPTQHFANRGLNDMCECLWGSWAIIGPKHRYFFGGDTGYCDGFKQIGKKFGPFDFSAIPIGAYHPDFVMSPIHVNPEEAVKIHEDVGSKFSLGIHWGTFILTKEPILEPPKKLVEALKEKNIDVSKFFVMKHGEVKILDNQ